MISRVTSIVLGCALAGILVSCSGTVPGPEEFGGLLDPQQLISNPAAVDFGDVVVGSSQTESVSLTNSATGSVTITQVNLNNPSFSLSGLALPLELAEGQSASFLVSFIPTVNGSASDNISIVSNASNSPTTIPLTGTGVGGVNVVSLNPSSIDFGDIAVSQFDSRGVTLTNSGGATVIVSQANVTPGTDFSVSGIFLPLTLAPGATTTFTVDFAPSVGGAQSGSVSIVSDASNSPTTLSLSGAAFGDHPVDLSWDASVSTVAGHYVYRSTQSGGPYATLNIFLVVPTTFTDGTAVSGVTYFYVVTAVDANALESVFSNEASAVIPLP